MHIPNNDPTNTDRAQRGETALTAYATATRCPEDQDLSQANLLDKIARDLVTDLLHRLDRAHVHPGVILQQAYERYREEARNDDPGDQPSVAYASGCQYCDVERGHPCRWGCESWKLYGQTRHTVPEQLDDEPEPASSPDEQPVQRRYEIGVHINATAQVDAPDADTAIVRLDVINGTTISFSREEGAPQLKCLLIGDDPEIIQVTPPDPGLKPYAETTITEIPL